MATKKQKRERGLAKREAYMAEVKASGLAAQKADQEHRREVSEAFKKVVEKKKAEYAEILATSNDQYGKAMKAAR